ncbi:hypothetical protein GCM10022243_49180 [Saccharothrix violaceirubra]|uniref:Uncharacterized protein n=1 Tax=Saccharothrix violaceirubra TaxID=413306 RepID=A0A7W7WUT2_9PSEU|nr:hypothetical protein [Saccharothrix violaceirubra]MBB4963738.1 hypothetical protein [Saccharothrix violaceirubra]
MSPSRFGDPDDEAVTADELLVDEPAVEVPEQRDQPPVPHVCDGGWVDPDADRPVPCPVCQPWLAVTVRVGICPPRVRPARQESPAVPSSVPVDARGDRSA